MARVLCFFGVHRAVKVKSVGEVWMKVGDKWKQTGWTGTRMEACEVCGRPLRIWTRGNDAE